MLLSFIPGIWSKEVIPEGAKFGPFLGVKTVEATPNMDPMFIWQVGGSHISCADCCMLLYLQHEIANPRNLFFR